MTKGEELPSHASPMLAPVARPSSQILSSWADLENISQPSTPGIPQNLISPAFTPPLTPSIPSTPSGQSHHHHEPRSYPVDTSLDDPATTKQPRLVERLPNVECVVRARIPTTSGTEMFLHLYQNDIDNKEHLAIVFGNRIRSRSLDAEKPGETEMDRMIRGAYTGRLRPGRTSSRREDENDLRRKVLRQGDTSKRQRSGSALKHVQTVPEDEEPTTTKTSMTGLGVRLSDMDKVPKTENAEFLPLQDDEQNSEITNLSNAMSKLPSSLLPYEADDSQANNFQLKPSLVRIHSECYTGETAWSARCDCGEQLDEAARLMSLPISPNSTETAGGVIVYLRQEGRGIGLASKLRAYNLQDLGNDTVEANLLLRHPADARSYGLATSILQDLGLGADSDADKSLKERGIRLLTNNPDKVRAVEGPGKEVKVVERVAMIPINWRTKGQSGVKGVELQKYLETKMERMGHMIHDP